MQRVCDSRSTRHASCSTFEAMEARRMFVVGASAAAGVLYVYGDDDNNGISVQVSGNDLVVKKYVAGGGYQEFYRTSKAGLTELRVYGRDGADTITVADGVGVTSYLHGEGGADYLKGGGLHTHLYGHRAGATAKEDDNAADTLVAGSLSQVKMYGQGGNDQFHFGRPQVDGWGGQDWAYGGAGDDTFFAFKDQRYLHQSFGGTGVDTIDFSGYGIAGLIQLGAGKKSGSLEFNGLRNYEVADVENAKGTNFADEIRGNAAANKLLGTGGGDTIVGDAGNDTVEGGSGNDSILGGAGHDRLYGPGRRRLDHRRRGRRLAGRRGGQRLPVRERRAVRRFAVRRERRRDQRRARLRGGRQAGGGVQGLGVRGGRVDQGVNAAAAAAGRTRGAWRP